MAVDRTLEPVCWVVLDDTDLHYLEREYTVDSAVKITRNPTASADEHIAAKVYLGAARLNGVSQETFSGRVTRRQGLTYVFVAMVLLFATCLGISEILYWIFGMLQ